MPKILVGRFGFVWDTVVVQQNRANVKEHSCCTKLHLRKSWSSRALQVSSYWDQRESSAANALYKVCTKCISSWVQYTHYFVHCKKTYAHTSRCSKASKVSSYEALRHKHITACTNDWKRSCAHSSPQRGRICIMHATALLTSNKKCALSHSKCEYTVHVHCSICHT